MEHVNGCDPRLIVIGWILFLTNSVPSTIRKYIFSSLYISTAILATYSYKILITSYVPQTMQYSYIAS